MPARTEKISQHMFNLHILQNMLNKPI